MRLSQRTVFGLALALASKALCLPYGAPQATQLPVVDLGYELHRAFEYNQTGDWFKFQNVRYAQAPVGDLRWRAPRSPKVNRTAVQDGSGPWVSCPQGFPDWNTRTIVAASEFANGQNFSLANFEAAVNKLPSAPLRNLNVNSTEDCLMLDVYTPRKAINNAGKDSKSKGKGAPVLVWIHGGGWVLGSKTETPTPAYFPYGMLQDGEQETDSGLVIVQINYRLGALGLLAGTDVAKYGDLNAGLLDQRKALEWVQKNIHLFGGDADRVTIVGESAGGGSVVFQTAAYGGKRGPAPFKRIISTSPGAPIAATYSDDAISHKGFLDILNVSSIVEARKLSSDVIIKANELNIKNAPSATYLYGPVVDGSFLPATLPKLLKSGAYDKSVKTLVGVNSFEGGLFYDPSLRTEDDFTRWLNTSFKTIYKIDDAALDLLTNRLYPPVYDGSLGYTDIASRQMAAWGEAIFYCNAEIISNTLGGWAYEFSVTPGYHTQDLDYVFDDGKAFFPEAQKSIQHAYVGFAVHDVPEFYTNQTGGSSPAFPRWDPTTRHVLNITNSGGSVGTKLINQTRCNFWLQ